MKFRELLPASCPPSNHQHPQLAASWRLLKINSAQESDFDSHRKRFPNKPFDDECAARSVSLVTTLEACRMMRKSPKPNMKAFKYAVCVVNDKTYGVFDKDGHTHVSLWLVDGVNPIDLTRQVEEL